MSDGGGLIGGACVDVEDDDDEGGGRVGGRIGSECGRKFDGRVGLAELLGLVGLGVVLGG